MHKLNLGREEGSTSLLFLWSVAYTDCLCLLFLVLFGVIGGLCSVIVALPGHLQYYSSQYACFKAVFK